MLSLLRESCAAQAFPTQFALARTWLQCAPRSNIIVLEGMYGVGKSTVAQLLVNLLGPSAKLYYPLPEEMRQSRMLFDVMSEVEKRQFYFIGNLAAMAQVDAEYCVFDRSFASTVAYQRGTMAAHLQHHLDRPPMLRWPASLRPNHYFYLTCDEPTRLARLAQRPGYTAEEQLLASSVAMREEIDWSYRHFENIQEIDVTLQSQEQVAEQIFNRITN